MNELKSLLEWYANHIGIRPLELCSNPQEGFEDVIITADKAFYGIRRSLTADTIEMINRENTNFAKSHFTQDFTQDFPRELIPRFFRIATDMLHQSQIEGFEFYNGTLARLKDAYVNIGHSAHQTRLHLVIGGTSYFTAVATNIYIRGYQFRNLRKPNESNLPKDMDWASSLDWRKALTKSPLANALAIHLFVYNDQEIIYLRRGKVGESSGLWNSPVNGVMEFSAESPDILNGRPDIRATAIRETLYELNMEINPNDIKWIGLVATKEKNETAIIGVCKTRLSMSEIARISLTGKEQREIREVSKTTFRKKEIRSIARIWDVKTKDISFGVGTLTIPYRVSSPPNLGKVIQEKILRRKEKTRFQKDTYWTDIGAFALLCCLAHLSNQDEFTKLLATTKDNYLKKYSSK